MVEIELDEIPTEDIVRELRDRIDFDQPRPDYKTILNILKADGCPENILNPLVEWMSQPVVDGLRLKQWKELCLR
jgi:hypothetical protein